MIHVPMFSFIVLALISAGQTVLAQDAEEQGICDSIDKDCIDGYVSLLQDSASMLKHTSGQDMNEGPASSAASEADATYSSSLQVHSAVWIAIAAVLIASIFYLVIIRPVQQSVAHANSEAGIRERRSTLNMGGASQGARMTHQVSMLEAFIVNHDNTDELVLRKYDPFDEDAYSLATALIIRDLCSLCQPNHFDKAKGRYVDGYNYRIRYWRLTFSVALIALTVFLQVGVLVCTKKYVTPQQVAGIRDAYDQYEAAMYGDHTYLNANGKHRGEDGFFNATAFDDLDGDLQSSVCNIPLSQISFISMVLLVWSITCMSQIKKCIENFMAITFFAETKESMADALTVMEPDDEDEDPMEVDDGIDTHVVTGLTAPVKLMMILFVFLPDFGTTCYLLWLGSRWLVATNDFGNLISNAVALEFVLMLKCLLFYALVSERNKRDLDHTGLAPSWEEEPAGYGIYFNTTMWAVFAIFWVWYYTHHQQVLPEYKWDVSGVCTDWLHSQLDPSNAGGDFF